ncbi:MAG: hypothetical protein HQM13_16485 [SAR324 cluster bacterium]|nr:hypothetical protein [SAR324 cluster bacterium]
MTSDKKKRGYVEHWNSRRVTTFYPQYGEGRDVVEAIRPVQITKFQQVIPRYNLSATDTRDDGVGPMFEEVPYDRQIFPRKKKQAGPLGLKPAKRRKRKRIRYDFSV